MAPSGRRLASLTLPQPELLRHDPPVMILPLPAQSGSPLPHLSPPSGALPLSSCLPASRIPSHGQTRVNAVASPHEPGSSSANIWRTTRTDLTLCTSEHVNDSVKWEVKGIKAVCAENMAFCYKLVIENRSSAPVTLCNVNILRHCIRSCIHKGLKISLDQYLLKCCNVFDHKSLCYLHMCKQKNII